MLNCTISCFKQCCAIVHCTPRYNFSTEIIKYQSWDNRYCLLDLKQPINQSIIQYSYLWSYLILYVSAFVYLKTQLSLCLNDDKVKRSQLCYKRCMLIKNCYNVCVSAFIHILSLEVWFSSVSDYLLIYLLIASTSVS